MRHRTNTARRGPLRDRAEFHRGVPQLSPGVVAKTSVGALEKCRLLHCLDRDKVLGELSALVCDALPVSRGIDRKGCKVVGATRQIMHERNDFRSQLAHEYQTADERGAGDPKGDLREARHDQRISTAGLEGSGETDDGHGVARQLEAIGGEIARRTRSDTAESDPRGEGGQKQLAVLGECKDESNRNEHPCDGAEHAVEALGDNETAVRLRHDENRQHRPSGVIERRPECDKERQ